MDHKTPIGPMPAPSPELLVALDQVTTRANHMLNHIVDGYAEGRCRFGQFYNMGNMAEAFRQLVLQPDGLGDLIDMFVVAVDRLWQANGSPTQMTMECNQHD